jgi:uncharacterized membrane protein
MKTSQMLSVAAVAAVMTVTGVAAAHAADAPAAEKCFGVVKAGNNDCKGNAHSCAGHAAKDADANEFIKLPAGACDKLTGGVVGK